MQMEEGLIEVNGIFFDKFKVYLSFDVDQIYGLWMLVKKLICKKNVKGDGKLKDNGKIGGLVFNGIGVN